MVIKQRAMQAGDKEERRNAILDAAQKLFMSYPDRLANVSEVADLAGLAKGTVYLYFPSKEELLLALHERNSDRFFRVLIERMEQPRPVTIDDVFAITLEHMIRQPMYLPLAGMCFGMMEKNISTEAANAFHERMAARIGRAGNGIEQHFPRLAPGQGALLLMHSYGLIVGLWQLAHKQEDGSLDRGNCMLDLFRWDYTTEIERALYALWTGTVGDGAGPSSAAVSATTVKTGKASKTSKSGNTARRAPEARTGKPKPSSRSKRK
jgi:AcrR family transcriptional regulator